MINTKKYGTKALAASLAIATALTFGAPAQTLSFRTVATAAAVESTYDANLGTSLSMQVGQKQVVTFPTSTTVSGKTLTKYVVKTTDNEVVELATTNATSEGAVQIAEDKKTATVDYAPSSSDTISFTAKKAGKATVTITSYAGTEEVGVQTIEVTSTAAATTLTAVQSVASLSTNGALAADGTVTVYKGEVAQIAVTTPEKVEQDAFSQTVADTSVADVIKGATDKTYGKIAKLANPADPTFKDDTYTMNFEAKKVGTTEVTVTQAASEDGTVAESTFKFKINVIERDGDLSVSYDADHDGKPETYAATFYNNSEFVSGDEEGKAAKDTQAVALDLAKNTTLQVTGTSANGQAVSYSSSDNTIATISNTGLITAQKTGKVTITVETAGSTTSQLKGSKITFTVNVSEKEAAYITVKDAAGEIIASSAGTYTGTAVPAITVGSEIKDDAEALAAIRSTGTAIEDTSKTIILSTKDKTTETISVSSNSPEYLTGKSDDTGIATYNNGTITAVKAGKTTITLATTENPNVVSTSTITLHVYVTDKNVNNTITANEVSVDGASKTADIDAKATYGTVVFDTKVYVDDENGEKKESTTSGVTVDAKGNVTYAPASESGTVYAKLWVENSDEALGTDYVYVPIKYSVNAINEIKIADLAANNSVELTVGKTASYAVSANDAATEFTAQSSDDSVATAAVANGALTLTGVAEGTVTVTISGKAKTVGYSDPTSKTIAVHVSAETVTEPEEEPEPTPATVTATKKVKFQFTSKTLKANAKTKKLAAKKTLAIIKTPSKSSQIGKVTIKVTTKVKGGAKKLTIKNKKLVVAKGTKVGTYKVKVTVAEKGKYKKTSKTLTIKVK